MIEIKGRKYEAEVVGLVKKMAGTSFTAYNAGKTKVSVVDDADTSFSFGRGVITTESAMKMILEEEVARDEKVKEKLNFLNS